MSEITLESQLIDIIKDKEMPEHIKMAKLEMLVSLGVDINATYKRKSALIWAKKQNSEKICEFMEKNGAKEIREKASLYDLEIEFAVAVLDKNIEEIKELFKDGLDINHVNTISCMTYAAMHANKEIMECLVENGADVNYKDKDGISVIETAIVEDNIGVVEVLVKNNADIYHKNKYGISPIIMMENSFDESVLKAIIPNYEGRKNKLSSNEEQSFLSKVKKIFSRD